MFDVVNQSLVAGELTNPWAGAGGGGGGSASKLNSGTFPGPWSPTGDEKGSGGGGGGGSLHVLALGDIVWGMNGQILNRGGLGGGGENTIFLNRVGGGSGGGSGGHVVLQSARTIDFRSCTSATRPIDARGGQGGAGRDDVGGATQTTNGQKETVPTQDACPTGYPASGFNGCKGLVDGAGGDGGPGIIQLHTSTGVVGNPSVPNADIRLPTSNPQLTLKDLCSPPALCPGGAIGNGTLAADCFMIPTFGRKSRAVSKWVALGEGGFDINNPGVYRNVEFTFGGTDPLTGFVQTTNGVVDAQPSILPALQVATATLDGFQMTVDATSLAGTSLVANPKLLEHYILQLSDSTNANDYVRFDVIDAQYDSNAQTLLLTVDGDGPELDAAPVSGWSFADIELQPAFFRVVSRVGPAATVDSLPSTATIQIQFQATTADLNGNPDAAGVVPASPTSDVTALNTAPTNAQLRFVRFQVLFDIAIGAGVVLSPSNAVPSLEFLRLPFRYQ
jgi:hypothetical protein